MSLLVSPTNGLINRVLKGQIQTQHRIKQHTPNILTSLKADVHLMLFY